MLVSCKAADDTLNQSGNILMFKLKTYQLGKKVMKLQSYQALKYCTYLPQDNSKTWPSYVWFNTKGSPKVCEKRLKKRTKSWKVADFLLACIIHQTCIKNTYKSYTIVRVGHFDWNDVMTLPFFQFFSKYSPFAVMHFSCLLTHLTNIWEKQSSESSKSFLDRTFKVGLPFIIW